MPVPPLPLELIALIVDELALSCKDDDQSRCINGRSIALVCRAWSSLGTKVVWRSVVLGSLGETQTLLKHFAAHPKLRRLVKDVAIVEPESVDPDDQDNVVDTRADELEAAEIAVETLLSTCTGVESLRVATPTWLAGSSPFRQLSHVPQLRHLEIRPAVDLELIRDTQTLLPHFHSLTRLQSLRLRLTTAVVVTLPPPSHLLPVRDLAMTAGDFEHHTAERLSLQLHLFNMVNPSTLRTCTILLIHADIPVVHHLATFTNLSQLRVIIDVAEGDGRPVFEKLLIVARALPSLGVLAIAAQTTGESVDLSGISGCSSLSEFLYSKVPHVRQMHFKGFHVRRTGQLPVVVPTSGGAGRKGAEKPIAANYFLATVGEEKQWMEFSV